MPNADPKQPAPHHPAAQARPWRLAVLLTGVIGMVGCAQETVTDPLQVEPTAYRAAFDAAQAAFGECGFALHRADYRFGKVTSQSRGAPTLVEVWNPTNSTFDQAVESTLNDQRRIAEVTLAPKPAPADQAPEDDAPPNAYRVLVEVTIERMQQPSRRLTGTVSGRQMLADLRGPPGELAEQGVTASYWRVVGRDADMERRLLAAIGRHLAK